MLLGVLLAVILLIFISSIVVPVGRLGKFERSKREARGKDLEVERELYYQDILSLQHVIEALLIVIVAVLSVAATGWVVGVLIATIVALQYGAVARNQKLRKFGMKQYVKIEPRLLRYIAEYSSIVRYIRIFTPEVPEIHIHSKDELAHAVKESSGIMSSQEKSRLLNGLTFSDTLVRDVMTPRSMIDSINTIEVLGPLVLDDLHKRGHSRFPVIETDVDHVVGTLYVREAVQLDRHKRGTAKVEDVMEARVLYINESQNLQHALGAFVRTHHHLFIVVNEYKETVGLLTLEDTIEALIGEKIVDEFSSHDDLRAVAARHPRANTTAKSSETV